MYTVLGRFWITVDGWRGWLRLRLWSGRCWLSMSCRLSSIRLRLVVRGFRRLAFMILVRRLMCIRRACLWRLVGCCFLWIACVVVLWDSIVCLLLLAVGRRVTFAGCWGEWCWCWRCPVPLGCRLWVIGWLWTLAIFGTDAR